MRENTRSILGFRKESLEAELLAKEPELMQDYIDVCSALLGIERLGAKHNISSTEFKPHRNAIDATEAYLDKVKEFTDPEVIIAALLDGGFAPNDKRRRYNVKDSFRYHTSERSSKGLIVKDGKLGKAEWITEP